MTSPNEIELLEDFKSQIIPKLLKEQKLINDISENDLDKFHIKNISVEQIGSEEAFMLTKCYRVHLTCDYKGGVNELHFFVKKTPQISQDFFDAFNFMALFKNELVAYEHILPALENFGKFKLNTAKFYHAELKSNSATVITEDFGSHQWMVTKDKYNLSLDHTIMAVRYLAKFHAVGFALRATDRTQFDEITQRLMEARYVGDDMHPELIVKMNCAKERAFKATRQYEKDVPDLFIVKLADLLTNVHQFSKKLVQPKEPFVTLCHGDYLRNNVAYRYEDNKSTDIMMFDLQTMRVSSPMLDLVTFLALSTLAEVRYTHFKDIFEAYCEQMKESYENFAQQPMPVYLSFESLLREYITFLPYSLPLSSWFLHELVEPLTVSAEEMLNQERTDEEIIADCMTRGGEVVDRELAHQLKEMWQLAGEYNIDVFKNI